MSVWYYPVMAGAAAITAIAGAAVSKYKKSAKGIFFKVAALALFAAFFVRFYLFGNEYIMNSSALSVPEGFPNRSYVALGAVQVWLSETALFLLVLFPFYRAKWLDRLAAAVGGEIYLFNAAMFANLLLAVGGPEAVSSLTARGAFLAAETGVGFALSGLLLRECASSFGEAVRSGWKKYLLLALGLVAMLACSMPDFTLEVLFGEGPASMAILDLTFWHRMFLYASVLIPVAAYLLLRNADKNTVMFVLVYYSLEVLTVFSRAHRVPDFSDVTGLPLHLCHTALYVTALCLLFRWKKVFYFTYFINVLGAFLAMAMPNYSNGAAFSTGVVAFWSNHMAAFYMPVLIVALGVFPRPGRREFRYSLIGFAAYFLLILFVNAWFSNYNASVDYFFINSDFIADKLGRWAEDLRDIVWSFSLGDLTFTFYPLYQFLFFLVYVLLALGMWFVYELGYDMIAGWADIRLRKKKIRADALALEVALAGRSVEQPMQPENADKLILKKFTKRYGNSDVYAVKDADLEVRGGEIFGFLGPNGAGKSTIIKSIVGIQTITDGAIEVCGYDVAKQPVQAKRMIGFVPDHYALYERLTAREYINYIADLYDVPAEERKERLDRYIRLFEFETAIDNQIRTYSHGMKQKVTIMAALIHNPKVWILDEPLTGLDPNSIFQVKECMKQHAKEGNIVFFSSHIIDVVERICDRIAIIRKGQIQCVRTVEEIEREGEGLEQFYMSVINGKEVLPVSCRKEARGEAKA